MEKKWYLGIDISKQWFDACLLVNLNEKARQHRFDNTFSGLRKLSEWLKTYGCTPSNTLMCMEHTGTYGFLLQTWLEQNQWILAVEPALQIKQSMGMQRGKSDLVDARRIAEYAYTRGDKLTPSKLPAKELLKVKQLMTYRDQLVKMRTGLKNSIQSHKQYYQLTGLDDVHKDIQAQIDQLTKKIKKLETQIEDCLTQDEAVKNNYNLLRSIKGYGLILSAAMLVSTHNFTAFKNGRQYACYAGVAPFENTSGIFKGQTKTSFLGNKKIKALLNNAANSASQYDAEIKHYYQRKTKEGKDHKSVMNAVACKLLNRAFAVIKRQTPFVITYEKFVAQSLEES